MYTETGFTEENENQIYYFIILIFFYPQTHAGIFDSSLRVMKMYQGNMYSLGSVVCLTWI